MLKQSWPRPSSLRTPLSRICRTRTPWGGRWVVELINQSSLAILRQTKAALRCLGASKRTPPGGACHARRSAIPFSYRQLRAPRSQ
jgi:hypothetical protein